MYYTGLEHGSRAVRVKVFVGFCGWGRGIGWTSISSICGKRTMIVVRNKSDYEGLRLVYSGVKDRLRTQGKKGNSSS